MRRFPHARPLTALAAAVLATSALAGCAVLPLSGDCTTDLGPGDASSIVTSTGDVGDEPAVEFPTPLRVNEAERSVLVEGEGDAIRADAVVDTYLTVFDGVTGAVLEASDYSIPPTTRLTAGSNVGVLTEALLCATTGSRVVVVAPVEDFQRDTAATMTDEGADRSGHFYVVVIDIARVWIGKANGVDQLPQDGMPSVVSAVDGQPGVAVSAKTIPTELRAATIKAGAGQAVAADDSVVIHLRSWTWSANGAVSIGDYDTWADGAPQNFTIDKTDPVLDALVGAKVGSQILIVVPAADGTGGATIYVFDILGIDDDQ